MLIIQWLLFSFFLGIGMSVVVISLILKFHRNRKFARVARRQEMHHDHRMSISRLGGIALAIAFVAIILIVSFANGQLRKGILPNGKLF